MRPVNGIRIASSANDGIVCKTPVPPKIIAPTRGCRAAATPSGTPINTLAASDSNTRPTCSTAKRMKSGPNSVAQKRLGALPVAGLVVPFALPVDWLPDRKSRATASNDWLSSSAAEFMRRIAFSSMRPASEAIAAQAFGKRVATSILCSSTAS